VLEVRQDLHLVEEKPAAVLVLRELGAKDLQRDAALREALFGFVDLAHTAFTDEAPNEVFADSIHGLSLYVRERRSI
jgi:hypothetical protein